MKILILSFLFCSSINSLFAQQEKLVPYLKGENWGFSNVKKEIIIEPKFEKVGWFNLYGVAAFEDNNKIGFINRTGEIIINAKYDSIIPSEDGLGISVFEKNLSLCINIISGEVQSKKGTCEESQMAAHNYSTNELNFKTCESCCTINKKENKYQLLCKGSVNSNKEETYEESPTTMEEINSIVIDSSNTLFDSILLKEKTFSSYKQVIVKIEDKYGAIRNGGIVIPVEYDSIVFISRSTNMLLKENLWTLKSPKEVLLTDIKQWNRIATRRSCELAIQKKKKWGLVNCYGKEIIPTKYTFITPTKYQITILQKGNKFAFKYKDIISDFIYDNLTVDRIDFLYAKIDGKEGYIDLQGNRFFE